jgi:hypothetical protein
MSYECQLQQALVNSAAHHQAEQQADHSVHSDNVCVAVAVPEPHDLKMSEFLSQVFPEPLDARNYYHLLHNVYELTYSDLSTLTEQFLADTQMMKFFHYKRLLRRIKILNASVVRKPRVQLNTNTVCSN